MHIQNTLLPFLGPREFHAITASDPISESHLLKQIQVLKCSPLNIAP